MNTQKTTAIWQPCLSRVVEVSRWVGLISEMSDCPKFREAPGNERDDKNFAFDC